MPLREVATVLVDEDARTFEDKNVHAIYDEIASHFSSTRYKVGFNNKPYSPHFMCIQPWPIISNFISSISTGCIGLDSGTGNGKYLPLPEGRPGDILTIGLDKSINLLRIAQNAGHPTAPREVVWGDVLDQGWRLGVFVCQ